MVCESLQGAASVSKTLQEWLFMSEMWQEGPNSKGSKESEGMARYPYPFGFCKCLLSLFATRDKVQDARSYSGGFTMGGSV